MPEWLKTQDSERAKLELPGFKMLKEVCRCPVYIYGLVDPRTQLIRYIGKSIRPLQRLANHLNDSGKCHRTHWLNELKKLGLKPEIVYLERIEGGWPWQESEKFWIAYGRKHGWPLTNNTDGGDGVSGLHEDAKAKMREHGWWRGRKHTEETKRKIAEKSRGRMASPERRAKMSKLMRGRQITWGDALAKAVRKLTDEQVNEIATRLAAGEKVVKLAAEYEVHRTTISKIKAGTYYDRYRKQD